MYEVCGIDKIRLGVSAIHVAIGERIRLPLARDEAFAVSAGSDGCPRRRIPPLRRDDAELRRWSVFMGHLADRHGASVPVAIGALALRGRISRLLQIHYLDGKSIFL